VDGQIILLNVLLGIRAFSSQNSNNQMSHRQSARRHPQRAPHKVLATITDYEALSRVAAGQAHSRFG